MPVPGTVLEHLTSKTVRLRGRDGTIYHSAGPRVCVKESHLLTGGVGALVAFDFAAAPSRDRRGGTAFGALGDQDRFKIVGRSSSFHFNYSEIPRR